MKLILSERELEIIKQQEYKRGWYECDMAHAKNHVEEFNRLNREFEGEIKGFNKPSLATAEFRHEHGFTLESCQHESNGHKYHQPENGEAWIVNPNIPETYNKRLKCKKCGGFY